MRDVLLLLGSNMGDRVQHIVKAIQQLDQQIGEVAAISSWYETAAWGKQDQHDFLNIAVKIPSVVPALEVLDIGQQIEYFGGRNRVEHWGERTIDVDILAIGSEVIQLPQLQVPHPMMHLRRFTLMPLSEIAPNWIHPGFGKSILTLMEECPDSLQVQILDTAPTIAQMRKQ